MADFTTPNLCGGSASFSKILTDVKTLKDGIAAKHGADASAALSTVETLVTDVSASLKDMIPELPTIPNINVQAEFDYWRAEAGHVSSPDTVIWDSRAGTSLKKG